MADKAGTGKGKGGARGIRYGEEFPEEKPPEKKPPLKPPEEAPPAPAFPEEVTPLLRQILEELTSIKNKLGVAPEAFIEYYNTVQTIVEAVTSTQPSGPDFISPLPSIATWTASTAYSVGTLVKPTTATGYKYECTTAGTSGATEPTWPTTINQTVNDGTVVWTCRSAAGYQQEEIYNKLKRIAPKVTVINDGTSTLYVIATQDSHSWSNETPILIGEARTFYNVWELRLRSATVGNLTTMTGGIYRVTEYDFWLAYSSAISSRSLTRELAVVHNQAVLANANFLTTDLTPVNTPTTFRIQIAMSAVGNLTGRITRGGNTQTLTFNVVPGPALVADGLYMFDLLVHDGDSVNFRYSAAATIRVLRVQEIDSAS